jgi:hypothetical protein
LVTESLVTLLIETEHPSLNDDLSVSTSGNAVEYASIYDPAGRLIDTGNSSTSANIDVNNGQRVATAS